MEFITNQKGGQSLLWDGNRFTLNRKVDVAPTLPTYSSFKSSMYRSRRKRLHPLPKTRAEIDLTGDWVNTLSGERFLLGNECFSNRILIFSKDAMFHLLMFLIRYMLTEHSRSALACLCNFSPSMDLSMASSFLWLMPCYHPRPKQITTGYLHTSRKSYRIETCR